MDGVVLLFGIFAAIGGLGGCAAVVSVFFQRKRFNAEARKLGVEGDVLISEKALQMYEHMHKEAVEAKAESTRCQRRIRVLEIHIQRLERHTMRLEQQMREAGLQPAPFRFPLLSLEEEGT